MTRRRKLSPGGDGDGGSGGGVDGGSSCGVTRAGLTCHNGLSNNNNMCPIRRTSSLSSSSSSLSSLPSLLVVVVLMAMVCVTVVRSATLTPLVHMTNHCHRTLFVNESLILDLTENLRADRVMVGHLSCAVTLQAPPGGRLYLHVLQLAISDQLEMPDRLHIYEVSNTGKKTRRLTPSTGLYGVLERPFLIFNTAGIIVPDFRTAGPRMYLDYQGKPTIVFRGFRVLVTVFYAPGQEGSCRPGTFHCPYAGTCVPASVRCDSLPNCGLDDSSDEKSCHREYIVTDILEQYSARTAIIAGVAGSVVFLGVAALVLLVVFKYNRMKYTRGRHQLVRFTSGGEGACRYTNETDLTNLYAPPSYENVMMPSGKIPFHGRTAPRHCDPPPAYSAAVAALVHQQGVDSSDEDTGSKRRGRHRPALVPSKECPPSFELHALRGSRATADSDEDVRMHGTWPSDTDEEEEVRARRRRKGGKVKGKSRDSLRSGGVEATVESDGGGGTRKGKNKRRALPSPDYEILRLRDSTPTEEERRPERSGHDTGSSSFPDSHSDGSPSHQQGCLSTASTDSQGRCGSRSTADVVSETESQLASSKRNSRTESNSPDGSSSSIHSNSPAKKDCPASEDMSEKCLHHSQPDTGVIPAGKFSSRTSSDTSLNTTAADHRNVSNVNKDDFVDLNPLKV